MKLSLPLAIVLVAVFASANAFGQDQIIYPNKGQSKEQLEKDKYECYSWAKSESGFDPLQAQTAKSAPPETRKGGALKGAAKGAAGGAIGGAIAGDAGKGAAIGAGAGAAIGRHRQKKEERQQAETQQQAQEKVAKDRDRYNRAYNACLEGRGYTVK